VLFGLVPVLRYGRPHLSSALRGESRSISASRDRHQVRNLLVIVQVALALLLLVGAGLMIRTVSALHNVEPGFSNAREVETMSLAIPEHEVKEPENVTRVEVQILHKIESLPLVSRAALISDLPMEGGENETTYTKDALPIQASGALVPIRRYKYVSPGYFAATGARLIVGRDFTWIEVHQQTPVALISESLAREWWGNDPRKALGKQIRETFKDDWREVIGVVADLHDDGIDQKAPTIVYWPLLVKNFGSSSLAATRNAALVIRTQQAGSTTLFSQIQSAVATVNPNLPVANARTLESIYNTSLARTRITLLLLTSAGAMALFLGVIGIYGVISYSVSQRIREIGIRRALGCTRSQVINLFMRDGLLLAGIGSACGMIAAIGLTRLMKTLLFEVGSGDPLTYIGASLVMIITAIVANYLPTRRAALVDPMCALRAE
jgi:predicted permease